MMNIETAVNLSVANTATKSTTTNCITASNKSGVTFQEELKSTQTAEKANTTETKSEVENTNNNSNNISSAETKQEVNKTETTEKAETSETAETVQVKNETNEENSNKNSNNSNLEEKQALEINKQAQLLPEKKLEDKELFVSLKELNSKIETMKEYNTTKVETLSAAAEKNQYLNLDLTEKSNLFKTINFDKSDATFFLNLVENQSMTAQNSSNIQQLSQNLMFNEIKSEATQKSVGISQTLINCLNESMKTNKPFRIDFDNDIAVIMKVDANGKLSANFIPGSSAVENYLRNNIDFLRRNFDEQNLKYGELTYSSHDRQNKRQKEEKEQDNKES